MFTSLTDEQQRAMCKQTCLEQYSILYREKREENKPEPEEPSRTVQSTGREGGK